MYDSPSPPASTEAVATTGGLNALRRVLELLLQDREPAYALSPDLPPRILTMPGADWQVVIRAVMDGLLSQQAEQDGNAVSAVFNTLAGVTGKFPEPSVDTHIKEDARLPLAVEPPGDGTISPYNAPVNISIIAPEARTLRVINSIPGYRLCQLEGRNGIGKTLAARLLELVSGAQPYSALPHAWATLKQQLGPTTIIVSGLAVGQLQFDLTPNTWPDQANDSLGDSLGKVSLNGEEIGWNESRDLLQAVRIAGDESLVDALARALEERAQQALRWRTVINGMVDNWYTPLLELQETVDSLSSNYFGTLLDEAVTVKRAAEAKREAAEAAHAKAESTSRAQASLLLVGQRREEIPGLIDQLTASTAKLAENAASRKTVTQELLAASHALGLDSARREQVARWERLRTLRYRALQRALSDEDWYLAQLGEDERPSWEEWSNRKKLVTDQLREAVRTLTELDVTDDVRRLGNLIETPLKQASATVLRQEIATMDKRVTGKALLEGIRRRRREIEGRPTPIEVQATKRYIESLEQTTKLLDYLGDAMQVTDRKRENVDEAEQTLHDLLNESRGISQEAYESILDRLRKLQEEHAMQRQERDGIRLRLARLLNLSIPEVEKSNSQTSESRSLAEEEEAEEQGLLSGDTVPQDTEQLDLLSSDEEDHLNLPLSADEWMSVWRVTSARDRDELSAIGYELSLDVMCEKPSEGQEDELNNSIQIAKIEVQDASRLEQEKMIEADEAKAVLQRHQDEVSQARYRLRNSAEELVGPGSSWQPWSPGLWLLQEVAGGTRTDIEELDSIEINVGDLELSEQEFRTIKWIEIVSWLSERMSYVSDSVRDGLDSVAGILQAEARELSPRGSISHADNAERGIPTDYRDITKVRGWAEKELAALLNAEALRRTLFDDAIEVNLSLESATVSWTEPNFSYINRRPLEAFSSGEQVFAYTRARLEQLQNAESWRGHRLVILDEFGAFVARNRFAQLLEFVYKQALGSIADQVVVMLPLSSDYANEAYAQELIRGASDASRRSDLLEITRQVQDRGYFAAPVEVATNVASE